MPATAIAVRQGHQLYLDRNEKTELKMDEKSLEAGVTIQEVAAVDTELERVVQSPVDVAINEALTFKTALKILVNRLTWLPAFAYLTTFGLELAIDGQMANIFFALYSKKIHGFDQTKAGYYTSVLWENPLTFRGVVLNVGSSGFLNLVTRPFGGFAGDWIYKWFGTKGKKYWTLICGLVMGATFLAGGLYLENNQTNSQCEPLIYL
jgi:NNP family nitrate/nitrite transporter-like MFS transporter